MYGIDAISEGKIIMSVTDIFGDIDKAEQLISLCNRNKLSIIHLNDIINDFLD